MANCREDRSKSAVQLGRLKGCLLDVLEKVFTTYSISTELDHRIPENIHPSKTCLFAVDAFTSLAQISK